MLFLTNDPLDGALGLIYFVCCCCTSCVQLKSLKLHKSVLPKDIKMSTAALSYPHGVHLSADAVAGIDPQYLMAFCQELHALARTATADCSQLSLVGLSIYLVFLAFYFNVRLLQNHMLLPIFSLRAET